MSGCFMCVYGFLVVRAVKSILRDDPMRTRVILTNIYACVYVYICIDYMCEYRGAWMNRLGNGMTDGNPDICGSNEIM